MTTAQPSPGTEASKRPFDVRRQPDDGLVAGVAAGIADHLDIDPVFVRVAFVALGAGGGWGLLLYAGAWLVLDSDSSTRPPRHGLGGGRSDARLVGLAMIVVGVLIVVRQVGFGFDDSLFWPAGLLGLGAVALWSRRPASEDLEVESHLQPFDLARIIGGMALVVAGLGGFVAASVDLAAIGGLVAALVMIGGVAVIFLPWWLRAGRELAQERQLRIRADERADVAAHLHDSVLQTLALIQKRADDPAGVASLARGQERELRRWLFGGPQRADRLDFELALRERLAAVETMYGVPIEVVVVGRADHDSRTEAIVAAAGEAATNAAKFSGAPTVDVFAEVRGELLEVFVRDRGVGFERASIGADRRGITESIEGRMARAGGQALIVSEPGVGTEVELSIGQETTP